MSKKDLIYLSNKKYLRKYFYMSGRSLLHEAAEGGHIDACKFFVDKGINMHDKLFIDKDRGS